MKCTECPDYKDCHRKYDLRRKRSKCSKAKDNYVPTNADRIRAMSDEELAKFIERLAFGNETPWSEPFEMKFCKSCPTVKGTLETGEVMELYECDFTDGKCPHGDEIEWWLKQPAEGSK